MSSQTLASEIGSVSMHRFGVFTHFREGSNLGVAERQELAIKTTVATGKNCNSCFPFLPSPTQPPAVLPTLTRWMSSNRVRREQVIYTNLAETELIPWHLKVNVNIEQWGEYIRLIKITSVVVLVDLKSMCSFTGKTFYITEWNKSTGANVGKM